MTVTKVGSRIGSIRLTSLLGRGGMGQVYEGYDETLQRRVAVKAIRGERALSEVSRARFLHEARTLSSLRHPNICLVHDYVEVGGESFLVMERIEGSTLTHALEKSLSWQRKLKVAIEVADALAVAHARGIVHRDVKPDNLMLTPDGEVKVLDFGIARAEGSPATLPPPAVEREGAGITPIDTFASTQGLAMGGSRTRKGAIVGTPSYMSPEQARGEDVSPASDMYSFGLVLQRLFTEKPPHEPGLSKADLVERASRGESSPLEGLTGELRSLIQQLKALQPEQRPTASQVRERLLRLRDRPARRRRMAVLAILVLTAALAGAKYTVDLRHEREQAVAAQDQAEAARDQAQIARDQAETMNDFLVDLLASAGPEQARGRDVTVREILDRTALELPDRDDLEPSAKARFLVVTGHVYTTLGLLEEARSALESALDLTAAEPDIEGRTHVQTLLSLGRVEESLGELVQARRHYEQAAEVAARKIPDHLQARASVLVALGNIQSNEGDLEGSYATDEEALALIRELKGPDHPQVGMLLGNLANLAEALNDCERSIELNEQALRIFEAALGSDHPHIATVLNNVAVCYERVGRLDDAYDAYTRALAGREKVLGPEHPDTGQSLLNLAAVQIARGHLDEAQQLLDRGTAVTVAAYGSSHRQSVSAQLIATELAQVRNNLEAAERLARQAVAMAATLEGYPQEAKNAAEHLFDVLLDRGKAREVLELAEATLSRRRTALGDDHPWVADGWVDVAEARLALGDSEAARAALEAAQAIGYVLSDIEAPPALVDLAGGIGVAVDD